MKPQTAPIPVDDLSIPIKQRKSFLELTARTCRWPVGDPRQPGFFFCGGQTVDKRPYCEVHLWRSLQPRKSSRMVLKAAV